MSTQALLNKIQNEINKPESRKAIEKNEDIYKDKKLDMRLQRDRYQVMANMGIDVSSYGVYADMKVVGEKMRRIERNANEVEHTTNTGYGEELVPSDVLMAEILDVVPQYQKFVQALPGFHGAGLDKTTTKPILGDAGLMSLVAETTTGALNLAQGTNLVGTDKVTLNQKKYAATIDVSDELSVFSVMGEAQFEAMVRTQIARSWARTEEALIINGDTETGATGNVNSDDGAPTAGTYYLGADGLRKTAIVTDSNTTNAGALAWADFIAAINLVGDYGAAPEDCMWLFNRKTYNQALTVDEFKKANENGKGSIIFNSAALTNILGSDLAVSRDLNLTEADGKISTTAGNNTLGQFLYFWKPAVQWGYGRELRIKLHDRGSKGYQLDGWGYIGLGMVGQGETANLSKETVGAAINVTV